MALDQELKQVIQLGVAFMTIFTAFQTIGNILKTILDSIYQDDNSFIVDGYTCLAIVYAVFAVFNWFSAPIVLLTGAKKAMIIGAFLYFLYLLSFFFPYTWLVYTVSTAIGVGAAILWTGQGSYLTLMSSKDEIDRNSGIFWSLLQLSMIWGNIFVYYQFHGKEYIDSYTRNAVICVLSSLGLVGFILLLSLKPVERKIEEGQQEQLEGILNIEEPQQEPVEEILNDNENNNNNNNATNTFKQSMLNALHKLKQSIHLLLSRDMLMLSFTFLYSGMVLSFYTGIYGSSIGFTQTLGESVKQFVGISGIFIGIGEVIGGILFVLLAETSKRLGRANIVISGCFIHILAFVLIFINLPHSAPFGHTTEESYITSNANLAVFCSFLLGFGDSCFNTQIYSILMRMYADDIEPTFALFKFVQSIAAAAIFLISNSIGLHTQLEIFGITCLVATITFCLVECNAKKNEEQTEEEAIELQ